MPNPRRTGRCRRDRFGVKTCLLQGLALWLLYATPLLAQATSPSRAVLHPSVFGFKIPPAAPEVPDRTRVLAADSDGSRVVAKVHVDVGAHRILLLPTGELIARPRAETEATEKPFKPLTSDELAARLGKQFAGFRSKSTRRYACVYNTSEEFATVTLRILDTMLPGVRKYLDAQKLSVHDPDVPLPVIMFRTADEFRNYAPEASGAAAFYQPVTNCIVMYEETALYKVRRELAIGDSLSTIAHEGTHQILHNIGLQQRLSIWPMWISEGLAEYFAPASVGQRLQWKGAGQVNDLRMLELEIFLKSRDRDSTGLMINDTVAASRLSSTGYATAWSLTHYLAKYERAALNRYLAELKEIEPLRGELLVRGGGRIEQNSLQFQKHFGDNWTEMENRLIEHLKKLPYHDPFADLPHYVTLVAYGSGKKSKRDANVFHTREMAENWGRDCKRSVAEELQPGVEITVKAFPNRLEATQQAKQWLRGNGLPIERKQTR